MKSWRGMVQSKRRNAMDSARPTIQMVILIQTVHSWVYDVYTVL